MSHIPSITKDSEGNYFADGHPVSRRYAASFDPTVLTGIVDDFMDKILPPKTGLGWLDAEDGPDGASLIGARRDHEIAQRVTGNAPTAWGQQADEDDFEVDGYLPGGQHASREPLRPVPNVSTFVGYGD